MSTSSPSTSSRPLSRGAACLPCRKLKARCDGERPACRRCVANSRPDDCEYAIGAEVTRSRLLEENIALLEARIRELENPGESAPSVQLHDPRNLGRGRGVPFVGPSRTLTPVAGPSTVPLYPANVGQQPAGRVPDPTPQEMQFLVETFMTHASQLGFFLNPTRFRRRGAAVSNSPAQAALINAVFLWGSRLTPSPVLRAREAHFADAATQAAAGTTMMTTTAPPHNVLHTIQAEVLLANYFFTTGRLLEGKYHCLAAVALVTGSRFHLLNANTMSADPVAGGENIRAFWMVVSLDRVWAAVMNTPPSLCQSGRTGIQVTTPWPLSTEAYEQGLIVPQHGGNYTVEDFIRGAVDDAHEEFSPLAIRTKAGALYERAIYVSSQYRIDMPNRNEFLQRFNSLDSTIEHFYRQLAVIRDRSPDDMRELLVSLTFACAAAIQLHSTFSNLQQNSWHRTVLMALAASRAVDIVDISQYPHLDPVIAVLWSSICKVLIGEVRRLRLSGVPVTHEEEANITAGLDRITGAMSTLAFYSSLMGTRLAEIQQARAAMN